MFRNSSRIAPAPTPFSDVRSGDDASDTKKGSIELSSPAGVTRSISNQSPSVPAQGVSYLSAPCPIAIDDSSSSPLAALRAVDPVLQRRNSVTDESSVVVGFISEHDAGSDLPATASVIPKSQAALIKNIARKLPVPVRRNSVDLADDFEEADTPRAVVRKDNFVSKENSRQPSLGLNSKKDRSRKEVAKVPATPPMILRRLVKWDPKVDIEPFLEAHNIHANISIDGINIYFRSNEKAYRGEQWVWFKYQFLCEIRLRDLLKKWDQYHDGIASELCKMKVKSHSSTPSPSRRVRRQFSDMEECLLNEHNKILEAVQTKLAPSFLASQFDESRTTKSCWNRLFACSDSNPDDFHHNISTTKDEWFKTISYTPAHQNEEEALKWIHSNLEELQNNGYYQFLFRKFMTELINNNIEEII